MDYRALLTLDYTGSNTNEYQQLFAALEQVGWEYAETSAMHIECDSMTPIRKGLEVLARAVTTPGTVSAMSLQVQLVGDAREVPGAQNHRSALDKVLGLPLPIERN